ncbi:hypothetical protein BDU57DRAFT_473184 [Ampelomyces quisqualis]|uniref:BRCT domain-containing protein n=1 Tax=Ampelomyces quisqualis TaxID=50730 RepID=A0A6A5QUL7_AMPQU|nr:hypothetical protein BDU57DRAFT_473184 [Ampelomyces quisqualis]
MSWALLAHRGPGLEPQVYPIRNDSIAHIVLFDSQDTVGIVHELPNSAAVGHAELGRITVGAWGAKVEAVDGFLTVLPAQKHTPNISAFTDPRAETYQLQSHMDGYKEILFLRDGDVIGFSKTNKTLTCKWGRNTEIQVNSSAAEAGKSDGVTGMNGVANTPEDETEDEDLDDISMTVKATQTKSQQPQPTPQLSEQRSVVVQETPTVARFDGVLDDSALAGMNIDQVQSIERSPKPTTLHQLEADPHSTAHTGKSQSRPATLAEATVSLGNGHNDEGDASGLPESTEFVSGKHVSETARNKVHPRVVIAKKRPSLDVEEADNETEHTVRPSKRARRTAPSEDESQDSHMSNILVDNPPTAVSAKRGKKRESAANDTMVIGEATPSRSQQSSQRSTSAPSAVRYSGETPCVATSNSSISDKGQAVKFLRKQGGSLVDSVKDAFNILCVRDGELHKTPKVLKAIATGTPIVTDKWLTDSAKINHFLAVDTYIPTAPKQEKEWDFKLKDVIGQPQTPFKGYILHFTTSAHALYKPFTEIEQICKAAGAEKITKKRMDKSDNVIVLAAEEDDKEAEKFVQDGARCYYRGIIPKSIVRGNFELDSDEFRVGASDAGAASTAKESKTRRGRKI